MRIGESKVMNSLSNDTQLSTSFPNQNEKNIDYVIVYKKPEESGTEQETYCNLFFKQIENESIELMYLDDSEFFENETKFVYVLLHCPIKRLLIEAEAIGLEMNLKTV